MNEFAKYDALRADGMAAGQAYTALKSEGANLIAGIRMLRASYGLTLIEAQRLCFYVDTGRSIDEPDPQLKQAIVEILGELTENQEQLQDSPRKPVG